jgi:hypothetical protein
MAWYLNRALSNFRDAVNARWPNRDKTSDGTIGDPKHQASTSNHNPDPAGEADAGSVDAWDMDVDGVDVWACIAAFEDHESASYWIYNDQIAKRFNGWRRDSYAYAGAKRNRHTTHVHFNTRESHEDSPAPWRFPEMGVDLNPYWGDRVHATLGNTWTLLERLAAEHALIEQIKAAVEQLATPPPVDAAALAAALAGSAVFVDALAVAVVEKLGDTIPTLEDLERVTRDEMLAALRGTRLNPDL